MKVVEGTLIFSAGKCRPKNVVFNDILFIAIFANVTENKCIMHRRSHVTGCNITYSLLLSISTTSLIFPPSVIVNFRKIISARRTLFVRRKLYL